MSAKSAVAKWQAAGQAVTEAERALADLGGRLDANAKQRADAQAELEAMAARAVELEKQLKSLGKEREVLRSGRKRAKRGVKKSRQGLRVTQAKFDKALLKDMLRKARAAESTVPADAPARTNGAAPRRPAPSATRRRTGAVAPATKRKATANGRSAPA